MADEERKIIIDEDWKAQVQKEKEKAKEEAQQKPESPEAAEAEQTPAAGEEEASFLALVQTLATQCLFALGLIAPQNVQQVTVDIAQARYLVDLLIMLREKTKGNLSSEEEGALAEAISELQRAYVTRAQQVQEATLRQADQNLKNPQK